MKNKTKLKLYIHRGVNKSSYFFTLGNYGEKYHLQTCKVWSGDYHWFIDKLKNDYGLIFPKNFKCGYNYDSNKDYNKVVTVYKDFTIETKRQITATSMFV